LSKRLQELLQETGCRPEPSWMGGVGE